MKVLVATEKPFSTAAVAGIKEIIEGAGYQFATLEKYTDTGELITAVADVDALIIRTDKITAEVLNAAKNLKIVVRAGAGYDNIDLAAATARKIVVMNTPGQNSNGVAELTIAMMIFMARNQFTPATGSELEGKRLGIQAFGNVGRLVGKKAEAMGMKVTAIDPFIPAEKIREAGVEPAESAEQMYSSCMYISIHMPATPETIGSIGYDLIVKMPKGACLINAARKEVIDEAGLEKALDEREDLKYITDVAPDNYEVLKEKFGTRIFATPKKMGAQTAEANLNAGLAAARQIVDFFATGNTRFQVNK
ncbi:MAG: 3-phosphoglycerate dehydrogenase [Bacteroidales bacterium]|jgi:D-3-phosphoglycerate dehydrogenase|nr:NAD(P)-dependent oxidoreductase [Bacteroidota bacterium]NLO00457.1 3-phosphoglycerate dehydrogenase [Bacteroidales bacterium]